MYFTATWPREGVDFTGKRVGLIGTGSSGIQATPPIAAQADQLTVFQRTPNFSLPARHGGFLDEDQARIKSNYDEIFAATRTSFAGFPFSPIDRTTMSVSAEEREAILHGLWAEGGFKFLWGGFSDLLSDPEANEIASEFIRNKIRETVEDPHTAELLCPKGYPYGAKRPPIDTDYYETFNRDNVRLVDISETPIESITATGLRTAVADYELDAIVFATGFDAMTGSLLRIDVRGSGGVPLADAWADGPRTMLGIQVAGFPNLFTITGPGSPSVLMNMPVAIEYHVDWIADCIEYMREHGWSRVEATEEAQDAWVEHVAEVGQTLALRAGELVVRGREHPREAPGGDALRRRTTQLPRALRRGQGLGVRRLRVRRSRTRPGACSLSSVVGRHRRGGVRRSTVVALVGRRHGAGPCGSCGRGGADVAGRSGDDELHLRGFDPLHSVHRGDRSGSERDRRDPGHDGAVTGGTGGAGQRCIATCGGEDRRGRTCGAGLCRRRARLSVHERPGVLYHRPGRGARRLPPTG